MNVIKSRHTLGDLLRGHEAGTSCSDSSRVICLRSVRKSSAAGTKFCLRNMLHKIQLVWIRASWSRDKMTSIFNVASCTLLLRTVPSYTRRCLTPLHVPTTCLQVQCADLCTLGHRDLTRNWSGSYIMYSNNSALGPTAVYLLGKRNRKSITSVVAFIRFVPAFQ